MTDRPTADDTARDPTPRCPARQTRWPRRSAAERGVGTNPFDNPPDVANPPASGQKLSFAYFQRCINPICSPGCRSLQGGTMTNTCAGCHDNATALAALRVDAVAAAGPSNRQWPDGPR